MVRYLVVFNFFIFLCFVVCLFVLFDCSFFLFFLTKLSVVSNKQHNTTQNKSNKWMDCTFFGVLRAFTCHSISFGVDNGTLDGEFYAQLFFSYDLPLLYLFITEGRYYLIQFIMNYFIPIYYNIILHKYYMFKYYQGLSLVSLNCIWHDAIYLHSPSNILPSLKGIGTMYKHFV